MMKLGIIILNYNSFDDCRECINSIRENIDTANYTIYLIDNCSTDNSLFRLKVLFSADKDIKIISLQNNNGYATGNNVGMKQAINDGCELLLISNPDVEYQEKAIEKLYEYLISSPVGIVGPMIYNVKGKLDLHANRTLEYKGILFGKKPFVYLKSRYYRRYTLQDRKWDQEYSFYGMVMGCCFMAKSEVLSKVNFFDEGTFLYFEENILGKKLCENNIKVSILPTAKVIHNGAGSTKYISIVTRYYKYCSELYGLVNYCGINRLKILLLFIINFNGILLGNVRNSRKRELLSHLCKYYFNTGIQRKAQKIKKI